MARAKKKKTDLFEIGSVSPHHRSYLGRRMVFVNTNHRRHKKATLRDLVTFLEAKGMRLEDIPIPTNETFYSTK